MISTPNAPAASGPYSQGIEAGGFLFVAGQRPQNPAGGDISPSIGEQTRQVIRNLEAILAESHCGLQDVVKATVFLSDMKHFAEMNQVYGAMFPTPYPVRTTVGAQLRNIDVEIEVIAKIP